MKRDSIKLRASKHGSKFEDWNVGQNYKVEKSIGKGSYGEVAQAI